jgi:carbonic anhydrase
MKTQTKDIQQKLTPQDAYNLLVEGNDRFVQDIKANRSLQSQVIETSSGQYPFAIVLSCIDSRVPVELVFDQGIGDIFSARVAGNVINEDILGSMEYACKVAGSKVVVVLGHSKCGAVTAACQNVKLGNITPLLDKIQPAVETIKASSPEMDEATIEKVISQNVKVSIDQIREESPILAEMEKAGQIDIVGAMYDVSNGKVTFL